MKLWRNIICLIIAQVLILSGAFSTTVNAYTQNDLNNVNEKIGELKKQIDQYQRQASELNSQAISISNKIATLQNQQNTLKVQIELKQAERDQLLIEIEATQKRIEQNSESIGAIIAEYYYNDSISTIERIASSSNFADFVDEEVRLTSITDTISDIIDENKKLKEELNLKRIAVEGIIEDLDEQKAELARIESEQAVLLAETRNSEAQYRKLQQEANSQKAQLEAEQQRILDDLARKNGATITPGDPNKGGYPYSGYCPQRIDAFADKWGMYICECVSYTAWKVEQTYGYMPYWGGRGHAKQWIDNARRANYVVTSEPRAGFVGISQSGPYGHAVWVEYVTGDRVHVSQYNWTRGQYSEMTVNKSMFTYIDFGHKN